MGRARRFEPSAIISDNQAGSTSTQAASLFRRLKRYPRTSISMGSPNGAVPRTMSDTPGVRPISNKRHPTSSIDVTSLTIPEAPTAKSESRLNGRTPVEPRRYGAIPIEFPASVHPDEPDRGCQVAAFQSLRRHEAPSLEDDGPLPFHPGQTQQQPSDRLRVDSKLPKVPSVPSTSSNRPAIEIQYQRHEDYKATGPRNQSHGGKN